MVTTFSEVEVYKYFFICLLLSFANIAIYGQYRNDSRKIQKHVSYLLGLIIVILCVEYKNEIQNHLHTDGVMKLLMNVLSYVFDLFLYSYHFLTNTTTSMRYKTMLRYENTIHQWECGADNIQTHLTGFSTSLFFPMTSVDDINSCCHTHDYEYCCQIGRNLADQRFYTCLRESCKEWYCTHVIDVYEILLDNLGEHAYQTMHRCEDAIC